MDTDFRGPFGGDGAAGATTVNGGSRPTWLSAGICATLKTKN